MCFPAPLFVNTLGEPVKVRWKHRTLGTSDVYHLIDFEPSQRGVSLPALPSVPSGFVTDVSPTGLSHACYQSFPLDSGSPVLFIDATAPYFRLVGIHTGQVHADASVGNLTPTLTTGVAPGDRGNKRVAFESPDSDDDGFLSSDKAKKKLKATSPIDSKDDKTKTAAGGSGSGGGGSTSLEILAANKSAYAEFVSIHSILQRSSFTQALPNRQRTTQSLPSACLYDDSSDDEAGTIAVCHAIAHF